MKSEPTMPGHTCPQIDKAIDAVNKIEKVLMKVDTQDSGDMEKAISDIDSLVYGLEQKLEALREQNQQLRDCAEYWRDKYQEEVE